MTTFQLIVIVVVGIILVPVVFPMFFQTIRSSATAVLDKTNLDERASHFASRMVGDDEFTQLRKSFANIESYLPNEKDKSQLNALRAKVAAEMLKKGTK